MSDAEIVKALGIYWGIAGTFVIIIILIIVINNERKKRYESDQKSKTEFPKRIKSQK